MSENDIWKCPQCQTPVDISEQGFMSEIMCPGCGMVNTVHTVLLNFRLERVLGVGGMSIVLQARDLVLNRTLAIKVLRDNYRNNPERIARFEKECSLMAKVRHPNVVSVYSAGQAKGQFYIAMELVEGQNLELMVSPYQPMAPLRALSIIRQVANGLNAANKAGLLHRDIKPGNILVTRTGRAKVLDFGLSLGKADSDTEETIWATPFYVPPETLLREAEDVRTDIYALGMTLRYLLSGCETFPSVPQTSEELLDCKRNLQRPRCKELGIDESYADFISHMTAYDINARPSGYADLLQELDEVRAAQKLYEASRTPEQQRKKRLRRGLVSSVIVLFGLLLAWLSYLIATPAPVYEAVDCSESSAQACESERMLQSAEEALKQSEISASVAAFMLLARESEEPTMAAWGAVMAYYLAHFSGDNATAGAADDLLDEALSRKDSDAVLGVDVLRQIDLVKRASKEANVDTFEKDITHPVLRALLRLARVQHCSVNFDKTGVLVQQERAVEAFECAPAPYQKIASLIKSWDGASSILHNTWKQELEKDLRRLDYVSLNRLCDTYNKLKEKEPNLVQKVAVIREMCKFSQVVDEMLRRKFPTRYKEGLSIENRLSLVGELNNPLLESELKTFYKLAQSRVDEAAALNPHRHTPDSSAPFAAFIRKWLVALSPEQPLVSSQRFIILATPHGMTRMSVRNGIDVTGPDYTGKIVACCDYGMVIERHGNNVPSRIENYIRVGQHTYCALAGNDETGVWVDIADEDWRGPCYLDDKTLIHPRTHNKYNTAEILHRTENALLVRWANSTEKSYYVKTDKGLYLRENSKNARFYHIVYADGVPGALCISSARTVIRNYAYHAMQASIQNESQDLLEIRYGNGRIERFVNDGSGVYFENKEVQTTGKLTSLKWLITPAGLLPRRNMVLENSGTTVQLKMNNTIRTADVVAAQEDRFQLKWHDTKLIEEFRLLSCGCYISDTFPKTCKVYSFIGYSARGVLVVGTNGKASEYTESGTRRDVPVLEHNENRLRVQSSSGQVLSYLNDGRNLYVCEDSADGQSFVRMCEVPGKWQGYIGVGDKRAIHYFLPANGAWANIVKKDKDSFTVRWDTYGTTETFKRGNDGIYRIQSEGVSDADTTTVFYADAFTQIAASLSSDRKSLRISPKYGTYAAEVLHFDDEKMILKWPAAFLGNPRRLTLQDGTRIETQEGTNKAMEYRKRADGAYVPTKVILGNGKKCEILTVHDMAYVDSVTIYGPGTDNKAWVMAPNGQCRSADVLKYDNKELVLGWHHGVTFTYRYDSKWDMYRRVPDGDDGFVANLVWSDTEKAFLFVENNRVRACSRTKSFSGQLISRSDSGFTIQWDANQVTESFSKQPDGTYKANR